MTPTEQRYAQVEKEVLAITWGCKRFLQYLLGLPFEIKTTSCFTTRRQAQLMRIQRFRMRMIKYTWKYFHVPGTNLVITDALSRVPVQQQTSDVDEWNGEVDAYVQAIFNSLPATDKRPGLTRGRPYLNTFEKALSRRMALQVKA